MKVQAWIILVINCLFIFEYLKGIFTKKSIPSLPMWLTIWLSNVLSLITFFAYEKKVMWAKAFLNITDFTLILAVVWALLYIRRDEIALRFHWRPVHHCIPALYFCLCLTENVLVIGGVCLLGLFLLSFVDMLREINYRAFWGLFDTFERWYFCFVWGILVLWLGAQSVFWANIYAQVMIGVGFVPLFRKVYKHRAIAEPLRAWILALSLSILGVSLAYGNLMMMIYTVRSTIMCSVVIILILILPFDSSAQQAVEAVEKR